MTITGSMNPSVATWTWQAETDPSGNRGTVPWLRRPITSWRRVLLGRVPAEQVARLEVQASLASPPTAAAARTATPG